MTTIKQAAAFAHANHTSLREGFAMADAAQDAADRERAAADAARYESGTGSRSMKRLTRILAENGTLTRKQAAMVRRAMILGKPVPTELVEAL